MRKPIAAIVVLLALVAVVGSVGVARAELTSTAVVYSWEEIAKKKLYQSSLVGITWMDGTWKSFWHELTWNNDPWTGTPNPCATGTTMWGGIMYYGVAHQDTQLPTPGWGFVETQNWELVDCDRDGDGDFDGDDQALAPPTTRTTLAPCRYSGEPGYDPNCQLQSDDIVTGCSTGNCSTELLTTFLVNLDLNCDGDLLDAGDLPLPTAGLCFYAEARVPYYPNWNGPLWNNPLQARISAGGGDKTVNFDPNPLAVELASFTAAPVARGIQVDWATVSELETVGFNVYRSDSETGLQTKLNFSLIPSKMPGSPIGASYSFMDRTARAGRTYYYWLEDLNTYGWLGKQGPVSASIPMLRSAPRLRTP